MSITGKVVTNLDKFQGEVWPPVFVDVPKIGSYIQSESGKILEVFSIKHCVVILGINEIEPYIEIEVGIKKQV